MKPGIEDFVSCVKEEITSKIRCFSSSLRSKTSFNSDHVEKKDLPHIFNPAFERKDKLLFTIDKISSGLRNTTYISGLSTGTPCLCR